MADDTDRLPELPGEFDEHADTIVLEESDIMASGELEALLHPETEPSEEDVPDDSE